MAKKKKLHQLQIMIPLQWCLITVESDNRETPEIDIITNWDNKEKTIELTSNKEKSFDEARYILDNKKAWDSIGFLSDIVQARLDDDKFAEEIEKIISDQIKELR